MSGKSISYTATAGAVFGDRPLFWPAVVFSALLILHSSLRFWNLTAYSLWGGEAFTMIGACKDWAGMFRYIVADIVHPPLFYVLLKLWIMVGGESLLWLKLFPVLAGLAVVIPFWLVCRELNFRLPEINLALLLVAVNGYLVHYTQELRMYSLFMFLALCSYWLFLRFFNSPGRATGQLVLLTAVNLLAIYTHYYGWLVVGMEFLFLLIWQRRRAVAFGFSVLFLLISFVPWAYLVVQEALSIGGLAQNLDWIPRPRVTSLLDLYVTFTGPIGDRYMKLLGLALFNAPVLLWGWQLVHAGFKEREEDWTRFSWLAMLAFLPVTALFLISHWMDQAVWMDRYFIFITIPYLMLVATAVYRLKPHWLKYTLMTAIVLWSLFAGFSDWNTNRMAWQSPQLGSRVDWDGLVQQMIAAEADSTGPIKVFTLSTISRGYRTGDWALSTSIEYFSELHGYNRFQTEHIGVSGLQEGVEEDHFWVGFFELEESPRVSPAEVLVRNGYRLGENLVVKQQNNRLVLLQVRRE